MKDIFFDCETTGINPYCNEIIDAYFEVHEDNKIIDSYNLKARPLEWCEEAEKIHGISRMETLAYPEKKEAYRNFLNWLPKDFRFITYANKQTPLGWINFDVAILENELNLLGCKPYYLKNTYGMIDNLSVHTLAKEISEKGLFSAIRNKSGRKSLRQESVYKALFNDTYNSHKSIDDVKALVRIYKELLRLSDENKNNTKWTFTDNTESFS